MAMYVKINRNHLIWLNIWLVLVNSVTIPKQAEMVMRIKASLQNSHNSIKNVASMKNRKMFSSTFWCLRIQIQHYRSLLVKH